MRIPHEMSTTPHATPPDPPLLRLLARSRRPNPPLTWRLPARASLLLTRPVVAPPHARRPTPDARRPPHPHPDTPPDAPHSDDDPAPRAAAAACARRSRSSACSPRRRRRTTRRTARRCTATRTRTASTPTRCCYITLHYITLHDEDEDGLDADQVLYRTVLYSVMHQHASCCRRRGTRRPTRSSRDVA